MPDETLVTHPATDPTPTTSDNPTPELPPTDAVASEATVVSHPETAEDTTSATDGEPETAASNDENAPELNITAEKVLDFAFGLGIVTAEAITRAYDALTERTQAAQAQAPAFFESVGEKGRPAREKLLQQLREGVAFPTVGDNDKATVGDDVIPVPGDPGDNEGIGLSRTEPNSPTATREAAPRTDPKSKGRVSAGDEIRLLEERVKELEQMTGGGVLGTNASSTANTGTPSVVETTPTNLGETTAITEQSDAATSGADTATDIAPATGTDKNNADAYTMDTNGDTHSHNHSEPQEPQSEHEKGSA